jgi:hypothetical protein
MPPCSSEVRVIILSIGRWSSSLGVEGQTTVVESARAGDKSNAAANDIYFLHFEKADPSRPWLFAS